jgi:membrane protease YdiL (CAAX protease family)
VLFAAIHPQGWVGIPVLATIALVLATLREWRGSIVAPVVAHACVNGVTVTILVMMAG